LAGQLTRGKNSSNHQPALAGRSSLEVRVPDPADLARDLETVRVPLEEASTLPARFYTDPGIYEEEFKRIFTKMWLCVAREEDLPNPGDYMTQSIGLANVILMRDAKGAVNAFHNVCRHRASRLLTETSGCGLTVIKCPYHAWTYDLDGSLRGAPHMNEVKNFDKKDFALHPVRLEAWDGFLFVNLDRDAKSLREHLGEMATRFDRYRISTLRRAKRIHYTVATNWKMLAENYSECYHCQLVHPELNRVSHYMSGDFDLVNQATVGSWMELREDEFTSMTLSGRTPRPPFDALDETDRHRIYYYILYPNTLLSLHPDYVMVHTIWPDGPDRSQVLCDFLFDPKQMARSDFDPSDAVEFWDLTNKQDWHVCELTMQGVQAGGYDRGRLSPLEWMSHEFDKFVADRLTGTTPAP
jgi:Rieske 2Fe-2S family protein